MRKNKLLILGIGLWATVALAACQKVVEPNNTPEIKPSTTPIELGVAGLESQPNKSAAASRAIGKIIKTPDQLLNENITLYGVAKNFQTKTVSWAKTDRVINTKTAKLAQEGSTNIYKFNYGTPAYYPANAFLNIYALYPSDNYITIVDDETNAPKATVTLGSDFDSQYDVLHGYTENLTAAQVQKAAIQFEHALAQLRIKIYREEGVSAHPTLSKVVVRGVSKATLKTIDRKEWINSKEKSDTLDFVAFDGSMSLDKTTKETAQEVNKDKELMLLPGVNSIDKITVTVDGNEFVSYIPKDWDLIQGSVNTLTLNLKKMELRLVDKWTVAKWGTGQNVSEDVENTGKMIQIKAKMLQAVGTTKQVYNGLEPKKADITVMGFTYKGILISSVVNGVCTTEPFNSGSVNDNPLYLEGLTLYDTFGDKLFEGMLENGQLQSNEKILIDTNDDGQLKTSNANVDLTMTFGGFGNGTITEPYEVHSVAHMNNINKLLGQASNSAPLNGTPSCGASFKQIDHIDFDGDQFTAIGGTSVFYGIYDGNRKELRNVNFTGSRNVGLFSAIGKKNTIAGTGIISNVIIASGTITGTNNATYYTGGIVGNMLTNTEVSQCENHSSIGSIGNKNGGSGGIVGQLNAGARVLRCANFGQVSGANGYLGGIAGKVNNGSGAIQDCYNAGEISSTYSGPLADNASIGGIVGFMLVDLNNSSFVLSSSYNKGNITFTKPGIQQVGSIIGYANAATTNTTWGNSYYIQGSFPGIGKDLGNKNGNMIQKTENQFKAPQMITDLGDAFKQDYSPVQINEGFPILKWQLEK